MIAKNEIDYSLVDGYACEGLGPRDIVEALLVKALGPDHGYTILECPVQPLLSMAIQWRTLAQCFDEVAKIAGCTWHANLTEQALRFVTAD